MEARRPQPEIQEHYDPVLFPSAIHTLVWVLPQNGGEPALKQVKVVRCDGQAFMAYVAVGRPRRVYHEERGPLWGFIYDAKGYPRLLPEQVELLWPGHPCLSSELGVFRELPDDQAQYFKIKSLSRDILRQRQDSSENPYREICRMQEMGDNQHVLRCVEALQDDMFLHIVTNLCHFGSMENFRLPPRNEASARAFFLRLLEDVRYLQHHRVCHFDLSLCNIVTHNGVWPILIDLAMSRKIPDGGLGAPFGRVFGKREYMTPEMYYQAIDVGMREPGRDISIDMLTTDLWAATVCIFELLTGHRLWSLPFLGDVKYAYFVVAEGFSPDAPGEVLERILQDSRTVADSILEEDCDWTPAMHDSFEATVAAVNNLSRPLRELLHGVFRDSWRDRWKIQDVLACEWIAQNPALF